MQQYIITLEASLKHTLEGAITRGELVPDLDARAWARKLATTLLGMMVLIRARVDPSLAQDGAAVAIDELHGHARPPQTQAPEQTPPT